MGFGSFFGKLWGGLKTVGKVADVATEVPVLKEAVPVIGQADAIKDAVKDIVSGGVDLSFIEQIRQWPEARLSGWLVHLGQAFGPPGIRHFSQLASVEQSQLLARIPVLTKNHDDWPDPLKWVPRRLTCWLGPPPNPASIVSGNTNDLKPIPNKGQWYVLPGYMASTTAEGIHGRLGWRWDDVDGYYELSFALKKF